ncbi:MAG: CinA family nicotinamide mononucleotide deamidase-related protein [Tannerellaceae bacterium]|jgi:nicotinamide-nucleotide amidase|nr:CinA family nicotinamide mononucleotide deamidase-related protein [Tannerellaceae bacterium]
MDVEIITIGDELLIGQVVDTNSLWMGEKLGDANFSVRWKTTVGDDEWDILEAVSRAMRRARIVLLTGGLGPTKDDITRIALCKFFSSDLRYSKDVYTNIKALAQAAGRDVGELSYDQAMVPEAATIIHNQMGTAPCTWFERKGRVLASMPGVPHEMRWLMEYEIIPRLTQKYNPNIHILRHHFLVGGYTESALAVKLEGLEMELPSYMKLSYLPSPGVVRLRLTSCHRHKREAENSIAFYGQRIVTILGSSVIATRDRTLEYILGESLIERKLTLCTAESCTGGRLAAIISSVAGCSRYFKGGMIAYSDGLKIKNLGVTSRELKDHGAVSQLVVERMALSAAGMMRADCAIATSGIAGPSGGTEEKPVGTVWIAVALGDNVVSECFRFGVTREQNIERASNMGILMLLKLIRDEKESAQ